MGLDALAVYIHDSNPLKEIALDELAEIYGDEGKLTKWSQLGIKNAACSSDEILRIGRQNNSGTYAYFREAVLGRTREFKLGSVDQSGSKDVVELVSRTPCAIGYSGMAYGAPGARAGGGQEERREGFFADTRDGADGTIDLPSTVFYSHGTPTPAVKDSSMTLSDAGQKILSDIGYVPAPKK